MGKSQSRNQQQIIYRERENFEGFEIIRPIVVTGFGKIYPDKASDDSNLSWRVVKKLSENIKIIIDGREQTIPVIRGVPNKDDKSILEPIRVCYNSVEEPYLQTWLKSIDALIYVHLGVEDNLGLVKLETTGRRIGVQFKKDHYHHDEDDTPSYIPPADEIEPRHLYPDLNLESETSDKEPHTSFKISGDLCDELKAFKSKIAFPSCSNKSLMLTYKPSDDAGNFLCDFLYYVSLSLAPKKNVLFVHIPDGLPVDIPGPCGTDCYNQCMSKKADALAEVVEFLVKKLLEQIYTAPNDHTAATVEQ